MAAQAPILTIAVPIYNMERWLDKNLTAYCDPALAGRVEVICLNNASTDSSSKIISRYVDRFPQSFTKVDRDSRGYGDSINYAIQHAAGAYFRIVDADDWVDAGELLREVAALETCDSDIVLTDYETVDMQTGKTTICSAGPDAGRNFFCRRRVCDLTLFGGYKRDLLSIRCISLPRGQSGAKYITQKPWEISGAPGQGSEKINHSVQAGG